MLNVCTRWNEETIAFGLNYAWRHSTSFSFILFHLLCPSILDHDKKSARKNLEATVRREDSREAFIA